MKDECEWQSQSVMGRCFILYTFWRGLNLNDLKYAHDL